MLTIPFGKTMTYGEIADRIAKQKGLSKMSAQAVGGAVGHNSISLIIPCHRVVGTNGSLTGYAGGIEKKSTTAHIRENGYVIIFRTEERNSLMISLNAKTIQKSFTEQAKNFETKSMNFTKQEYLEHMISCVKPQKTDTVLEVAAGTCICGRSLAPFVKNVTCLDMTTAMLAVGKAEAAKQKLLNMNFVQGDAEKLPFSDNSFDIVISRLAFHHFPNTKRCFSEMVRVLKTGGKLVVMDMEAAEETLRNTEDEIETLRDPSHMRNLSKEEFTEMFQESRLPITTMDCTELPVSLSAWLVLTNTPTQIAADISKRFMDEINGSGLTGFNPYENNGKIYFNQRWLMMIGKKL